MGKTRLIFLLALGAGGAWAAALDTSAPPPPAEASATVTVTAEAVPVELERTPNPVTVIDKKALERRGAGNLGDLLQEVLPGQVLATGGVGTVTSIYLGGTRPQDTVVTLDGLRLNDATGLGGVNAGVIGLAGIERVEIQQGPCSTRFGSDALGGAVALYSAGSAPEGLSGEARAAAGNQGVRRGALAAAYGWDQGWVRASAAARRQDQALDPANPYRAVDTYLGLGRQLGDSTLVTVNYYNSFAGVPIPIVYVSGAAPRTPGQIDLDRQDFNRTQILSGTVRAELDPQVTAELTVGQVLQNRLEPDVNTNLPTVPYLSRRNQLVGHVTWRPSDAASLQAGLDGSEDFARDPDLTGANTLSATARHLAVLVDGERELGGGVRAVASLRTEQDRVTVPTAQSGTVESSLTQTTGKLGLNWALPRGFRAYASAGNGFSNPLLYQSLFNANYGGEALANEKSRTAQAGLTYASGPWKAGLEVSRTLFSNLVYYDPSGGIPIPAWGGFPSGIYRNGSQIRIQSAELKAGYETAAWGLDGFYRNQEARDLQAASGQQLSSSAVVNRPFQTLGANAYRVLGQVRLEASWSWIGPRYQYSLPSGYRQHFNDLGVSAAWAARENLTLVLRGEHLLQPNTTVDQWLAQARDFQNDAEQVFGYPAQPPTVTLEVRYRF
ncbi:MAG: TonB-dependent receptor [Holophaga sp.]|jgi:vitamin B12 transporter